MVQQFPVQTPPQQQIPNKSRGLQLVQMGIFELMFVICSISIILFILNYFTVINLALIFPPLASLPRQETVHTNVAPLTFSYNSEQANTSLNQYQESTIQPEYISGAIFNPQALQQQKNIFTRQWDLEKGTGSVNATLTYQPNTNTENIFTLTVETTVSASDSAHVSSQSAALLLTKYFRTTVNPTLWHCTTGNGISCEQFTTEKIGQTGFGLSYNPRTLKAVLFSCYVPSNSSLMASPTLSSCPNKNQ